MLQELLEELIGVDSSCKVTNCYNKGEILGKNKISEIGCIQTGTHILNNLFYLSKASTTLKAISGIDDNANEKIMAVNDDLSYEQFKNWIEEQ